MISVADITLELWGASGCILLILLANVQRLPTNQRNWPLHVYCQCVTENNTNS